LDLLGRLYKLHPHVNPCDGGGFHNYDDAGVLCKHIFHGDITRIQNDSCSSQDDAFLLFNDRKLFQEVYDRDHFSAIL
jgi:hypothetical protein